LASFLIESGESVIQSKEPTGGTWGQIIRQSAAIGRLSLEDELIAFIEDRKEHVEALIGPALAEGKTVILDRYFYSTIAYQGARGGDAESIKKEMRVIAPEPDVVLILDVPAELGVMRIGQRDGVANHFEDIDNLRAVRKIFLGMTGPNISIIDGSPSVQHVQQAILSNLLDGAFYKRHCAKHWGCDDPYNCAYRKTDSCRWALMKKQFGILA
jgi:dTMP kinase